MSDQHILLATRPSLRRAYLFAFLYVAFLGYGYFQIAHIPQSELIWQTSIVILGAALLYAHIRRFCTAYIISDESVEVWEGILSRRGAVTSHKRITNVAVGQNLLERILGLVNLYIDTAGTDEKEVAFKRITRSDAAVAGKVLRKIVSDNAGSK